MTTDRPGRRIAAGPPDGVVAAALFAVDPTGLGGVVLRGGPGTARDAWLAQLAALLPAGTPQRRAPLNVDDDRLLGGLDLAATLRTGRPIAQRGLLAEADGGIVLLAMAERLTPSTAAHIAGALDTGGLVAARHGAAARSNVRIGVVAFDEGMSDDERLPARLRERLAFHLDPAGRGDAGDAGDLLFERADVLAARTRLPGVRIADAWIEALCATALALGIASVRAPWLASRAARASAALDGRDRVNADDTALAAALVLAPRATRAPVSESEREHEAGPEAEAEAGAEAGAGADGRVGRDSTPGPDAHPTPTPPASDDIAEPPPPGFDHRSIETAPVDTRTGPVDDTVLAAALAALPPHLLARLALGDAPRRWASQGGRAGATTIGRQRGRPTGARRGDPRAGGRLHLIETLRAAAPWQAVRRREAGAAEARVATAVRVRREDFHVWRFRQRSQTTTVFLVDASGSAALHRLAEAKGAVELLLADCYVRRDKVALIAFRGAGAELLLAPTRSLVRAKRSLAGLPGGGGTPLAAGIASAHALADAVRRGGATPVVVLLTDGRANIARDGTPGRARAGDEAQAAARAMRLAGVAALLIDTSPQPQVPARELAATMGARYLPLPQAGAATLSQAVRAAGAARPG